VRHGDIRAERESIAYRHVPAGFFKDCYNAAMSRPFVFSMRRMFYAVSWFSLSAYALAWLWKPEPHESSLIVLRLLLLFFAAFACAGAGIGAFGGRQFSGAWWGTGIALLILVARAVAGMLRILYYV
jgi:hypothetical protein